MKASPTMHDRMQGGRADRDRRHHGAADGDPDARHRRREQTVQTTGNGPVDATFNAIKMLVPHEAKLDLYQVHAVTEGTDAQAEVSVRLEEEGRTVTGRGADTDTMVASARAYSRRSQ